MITCYLKYVIDPYKVDDFERYAKMWIPLVNKFGGIHHGYFLPHEGANNIGYALFSFPSLAEHFISMGHHVKALTTSESRLPELTSIKVEPFIIDVEVLPDNIQYFLQANIFIINVPSKNKDGFRNLVKEIEKLK